MTLKFSSFALLATFTAAAIAQTTTTPQKSTTTTSHRATTTTAATQKPAATPSNPADNPPGVPKIEGTPKPLYALRYIDTVIGTGPLAESRKYYTVHYTGWLTDGTKFDSSVDRGTPFTFPYGARQVIPGWDTGFEGMHVGGKRRLFVPYQLAYGESGSPPVIPAKADLIFDIELIDQSDTRPQPKPAPVPPTQPDTKPAEPTDKPASGAAPTSAPTSAQPKTQNPQGL